MYPGLLLNQLRVTLRLEAAYTWRSDSTGKIVPEKFLSCPGMCLLRAGYAEYYDIAEAKKHWREFM